MLLPPVRGGAVEEYVIQLSSHLNFIHVDALAVGPKFRDYGSKPERSNAGRVLLVNSIRIPTLIPRYSLIQELIFGGLAAAKLTGYDVVHLNSEWSGLAFILRRRRRHHKITYTSHSSYWFDNDLDLGKKILRKVENYVMKRSDVVIVLNELMKQSIMEGASIPSNKIVVIPLGVDTRTFRLLPHEPGNVKNNHTILFVGRITAIKGVDVLLRAFKILLMNYGIKAKLIVVGPASGMFQRGGASKYAKSLVAWAKTNLPDGSYEFLGSHGKATLVKLYNAADVFVLPSLKEAFGMVLLEAMACGCPIVASATEGIPYVIQDGINGLLFRRGDATDLAEKILSVLTDKELKNRLSRNGRNTALMHYDWTVIARSVHRLYRQITRSNESG